MLITDGVTLVRTRVDGISVVGRNTQGVTIIRLDKKEKVIGVDRIDGLAGVDDETDDELNDDLNPEELADLIVSDTDDEEVAIDPEPDNDDESE